MRRVIVQELLDGRAVSVLNAAGEIQPYVATKPAWESASETDRRFASWASYYAVRFSLILKPGERALGVWPDQAGYSLMGRDPFAVTDILDATERPLSYDRVTHRLAARFAVLPVLYDGEQSISLEAALDLLGPHGHYGALGPPLGLTWRVEYDGQPLFTHRIYLAHMSDALTSA